MAKKRLLLFFALLLAVAAGLAPLTAWAQATWSSPQRIDDNDGTTFYHYVAMSGLNVVAIGTQYDISDDSLRIYSNCSSDGGATWHGVQLIGENASFHPSWMPQAAMDGLNVVALWEHYDEENIRCNYSSDGGATWHNNKTLINNNGEGRVGDFKVAISGLNVVAVYSYYDSSESDKSSLYSNCSSDGGATWEGALIIEDNSESYGHYPHVAISGLNVVAVWSEQYYNVNHKSFHSLYSNYSTDGGASWEGAQLIEDNDGADSCYPRVVMDDSQVVAIWNQSDFIPQGLVTYPDEIDYSKSKIYSNFSSDGGAGWEGNQLIDSYAIGASIAIDGSRAVAVWNRYHGFQTQTYSSYAVLGPLPTPATNNEWRIRIDIPPPFLNKYAHNLISVLWPWIALDIIIIAGITAVVVWLVRRRAHR